MKFFLMPFILFGMAWAETNANKPAESKAQELKAEEIEVVEEVIETNPDKLPEIEDVETQEKAQKPISKKMEVKEDNEVEVEVSETESVTAVEPNTQVSAVSGVKYICDESRSYTFYQPGNDPNHLCELDAGHTEATTDWYALNDAGFCKRKIEELISQYNCVQEVQ